MIHDHDRSYYIGASDTKYVMGKWNTQTFRSWWDVKMGFTDDDIDNIYLRTGTMYEPLILDHLGIKERDRQIIIGRLRVNLDGEDDDEVIEVKTFRHSPGEIWKPTKAYGQQAQVEMYAAKKPLVINAYRLTEAEYENFFLPIDKDRLTEHPVEYDEAWIKEMYLPRLRILATCLKKGVFPLESIRQDPARRK